MWYYREVTKPITDYGLNLQVGDLIAEELIYNLPQFYKREFTKLLNEPKWQQQINK